ncbi:MAG TPA: hypothetical protein VNI79_08775 [Sphingomicrobium sp.]|nr:hypothetical protein [Sphingomicrobium sp.]
MKVFATLMALALSTGATAAPQLTTVATVPASHRLVEGVASDGRTIWVSSVIDRTILACRTRCVPLARLPESITPLGMAWDGKRQLLWIAADCPPLPGVAKCANGSLVALDRKGRLARRLAPIRTGFHPGDVSAAGGNVFVSDSLSGAVYRLDRPGTALTTFLAPGIGKSAQGSVLDAAGRRLILADYSRGVASIDLATGKRTLLPQADGSPLRGIDGIARCNDRYFTVFNAQPPGRLIAFTIKDERIVTQDIVSGPPLLDPTQLATDGKRLLIVANAGWEAASKPNSPPRQPAPIMALALSEHCKAN